MLDPLYRIVSAIILFFHNQVWAPLLGEESGAAWALSIVFLTITIRLLLFPVFVKQIRSQRAMQALAPQIKELQTKYKNDRERLNQELMKLYKDNNANPIAGCLPLLLQMPVFFALFNVLNKLQPREVGNDFQFRSDLYGIPGDMVEAAARSKIFGAPIAASFNSDADVLNFLGANSGTVRAVAAVMVVLMGLSTFITQKQMMKRSGPLEGQQAQIQKFMLYVLPFSFAISGFFFPFPLGVLLYWLTTNLWSMGQQAYVIKRMPPALGGGGGGDTSATPKTRRGAAPKSGAAADGAGVGRSRKVTGAVDTAPSPVAAADSALAETAPAAASTGVGAGSAKQIARRGPANQPKRRPGRRGRR